MGDAHRRKTTETLQREMDRIAVEAAARFTSGLGDSASAADLGPAFAQPTLAHEQPEPPGSSGEALHMLTEWYARLGGVLSLAVLVDEPGLLADDLDWLRRMLAPRGMRLAPPLLELVVTSYMDAAASFLQPAQLHLVRDQVTRALEVIATRKPASNG